ncbi:MAG: hypothetical protein M0031_03075 [Thermaerobacter sp.]|jgi:alpha-tubulin suppressor-like RCC1 family protein|nr:hypothetical protein [Thermaerobacter sp.]
MRTLVLAVAGALLLAGCGINFTGHVTVHRTSGKTKPPGEAASSGNKSKARAKRHRGVVAIAAGWNAGYALKSDGTVWA